MNSFTRLLLFAALVPAAPLVFAAAETHTAGPATIKVRSQFDAVVEATESEAVKLAPKAWFDLTVIEAVGHGTRVKKGDLLVKLDIEKLREQIEETELDKPTSALALEIASAELENLKQTTPAKLEAARRSARIADEDQKYFESTGRPNREKTSKFNLKSAEQRLDGASEELRQLEKMYKADDLTEETEQIVLRRQRFVVEAAQFSLASQKEFTERELGTLIPRDRDLYKNTRRDQEAALALAEQTLPKTLARKQFDFEKQKRDQKRAERRLADLRADLEILTPRAAFDGIVYHGACENGRWTTGALVGKKLVPGGKLLPNEIIVTVVKTDKLHLHAAVAEGELANLANGLKGEASPVSAPDRKFPVKIDNIGLVPLATGGFDVTLSMDRDKAPRLVPGMNCKLSFKDIEKKVAIAVPKGAVTSDTNGKSVQVQKRDGTTEKRTVKTGESDDTLTEITEGLTEGEKVVLKKSEQAG
jgi:multidrug resistance efflux pump